MKTKRYFFLLSTKAQNTIASVVVNMNNNWWKHTSEEEILTMKCVGIKTMEEIRKYLDSRGHYMRKYRKQETT